jgi:hypothetical protein
LVDSTTVVVLATLAQTVVITLTLLVFIFQFRSQTQAIRESSYQSLLGRYNDFIMTLLDKPELSKILINRIRGEDATGVSPEQARVYAHMLLAYGIMEEAYLLYAKKWMDEDNWQQWASWVRSMAKSSEFKQVHEVTIGTFDKGFQDFVSKVLSEKTDEKRVSP